MNMSNSSTNASSSNFDAYPIPYIVALVVLGVFIITVNLLVIILFATKDKLRTKTNRILVSLAVVDAINGLFTIPLRISCNLAVPPQLFQRLLTMSLYRFVAASTMFHILTVTLEKHICILYPLRYNTLVTNNRIIMALFAVWAFSIFYGVIGLSWLGLADEFHHLKEPPSLHNSKVMRFELSYTIFGLLFCFLIPLVIMCYSSTKIIKEISRHNRRESQIILEPGKHSKRLDRKPVLIFLTMMVLFVLNWSSWYVELLITVIAPKYYNPLGGSFTEFLRFTASLINPLLYSMVKKDFRQAVRKTLFVFRSRVSRKTSRQDSTLRSFAMQEDDVAV